MSDTPRTDEHARMPTDCHPRWVVPIDFARELERENAKLRKPKVAHFQDEIDAIEDEARFARELDEGNAPLSTESAVHVGEGGATTAYYQNAKLVGFSSRLRDPWNFTVLVCIDLR